jgi:hypothetical protein
MLDCDIEWFVLIGVYCLLTTPDIYYLRSYFICFLASTTETTEIPFGVASTRSS